MNNELIFEKLKEEVTITPLEFFKKINIQYRDSTLVHTCVCTYEKALMSGEDFGFEDFLVMIITALCAENEGLHNRLVREIQLREKSVPVLIPKEYINNVMLRTIKKGE